MLKNLQLLFGKLADPEFQAVLLGPFIAFALLVGTVLFIVFFAARDPKGQIAALVLIILGGLAIQPLDTAHRVTGPRVEAVTGTEKAGYVQKEWDDAKHFFLGIAVLATVTVFFGRSNKLGITCTIATIVTGLVLSLLALWLVYREALVYHPHLRSASTALSMGTAPIS